MCVDGRERRGWGLAGKFSPEAVTAIVQGEQIQKQARAIAVRTRQEVLTNPEVRRKNCQFFVLDLR